MFNAYNKKRIIHINGNIIIASVVSTLIVALIIESAKSIMVSMSAVVGVTAVLDMILDAGIFFTLHYLSSNYGKAHIRNYFLAKDVVRIHGHRIFLSPLFYFIAVSTQSGLLMMHAGYGTSVIWAYLIALVITRYVHTVYGIKTGLFK